MAAGSLRQWHGRQRLALLRIWRTTCSLLGGATIAAHLRERGQPVVDGAAPLDQISVELSGRVIERPQQRLPLRGSLQQSLELRKREVRDLCAADATVGGPPQHHVVVPQHWHPVGCDLCVQKAKNLEKYSCNHRRLARHVSRISSPTGAAAGGAAALSAVLKLRVLHGWQAIWVGTGGHLVRLPLWRCRLAVSVSIK